MQAHEHTFTRESTTECGYLAESGSMAKEQAWSIKIDLSDRIEF